MASETDHLRYFTKKAANLLQASVPTEQAKDKDGENFRKFLNTTCPIVIYHGDVVQPVYATIEEELSQFCEEAKIMFNLVSLPSFSVHWDDDLEISALVDDESFKAVLRAAQKSTKEPRLVLEDTEDVGPNIFVPVSILRLFDERDSNMGTTLEVRKLNDLLQFLITTCASVNTAAILYEYARIDCIPRDPYTRKQWGFSKCESLEDEVRLLGVYQGLLTMLPRKPPVEIMDGWREKNMISNGIYHYYKSQGGNSRYFSWFKKNGHLVDQTWERPGGPRMPPRRGDTIDMTQLDKT